MNALSGDRDHWFGMLNRMEWDRAKDRKEMTTTLIAVNEMVLHELNKAIDCAMGNLGRLVERYDRLSLVVSYSAQVRSAIKVLEDMKERTIDKDKPEKATESLGHMKRKLELLNKVEEDAKEGAQDRKQGVQS
jgi:hypothetical protein